MTDAGDDRPAPWWRRLQFALTNAVYGPGTKTKPWSWLGYERIAVGNLPTPASLPVLRDTVGVTHVVNCRAGAQTAFSGDLYWEERTFGPDRVATAHMWDNGKPKDPESWADAALFAAEALEDPDARVLIHCQRGRRRSVLVAYATLRLRGHGPDEAAEIILRHRRESHLVPEYRESVEVWLAETGRTTPEPAPTA